MVGPPDRRDDLAIEAVTPSSPIVFAPIEAVCVRYPRDVGRDIHDVASMRGHEVGLGYVVNELKTEFWHVAMLGLHYATNPAVAFVRPSECWNETNFHYYSQLNNRRMARVMAPITIIRNASPLNAISMMCNDLIINRGFRRHCVKVIYFKMLILSTPTVGPSLSASVASGLPGQLFDVQTNQVTILPFDLETIGQHIGNQGSPIRAS